MKTYQIKDLLKKDLLILELPEKTADFSVLNTGDAIAVCAFDEYDECIDVKGIPKGYTLLGKPDEISEDDVEGLIHSEITRYLIEWNYDYKSKQELNNDIFSKNDSFFSAIESEIFWVNPLGESEPSEPECECEECYEDFEIKQNDFMIAESRTFDRSRTLIFVKQ